MRLYARSSLALLWMKHFAYIKIYKRPSKIRTYVVTFEGRGDLNKTLIKELWLTRDCVLSTLEVMASYHKHSAKLRGHQLSKMKKKYQTSKRR